MDVTLLLYSDDPRVRDRMRQAIGTHPAPDLTVTFVETATADETVGRADEGGIDALLLDGEAWPAGGLGIARQLKDEIVDCPPCVVVLARAADRWLAAWSRADGVLVHPLDPLATARVITDVLERRRAHA